MDADQAAKLRAPFDRQQIGQKPQPYKKDSPKGNCTHCGGYHGLPAMHLDYVGHAAATDRLLQTDPEWTWEPMGRDQFGSPALDRDGNLWINLTVAGVTRPGVGDGANMKERISDALRNAAMRFGVALDLWAKEDLRGDAHEPQQAVQRQQEPPPPSTVNDALGDAKRELWDAVCAALPDKTHDQRTTELRESAKAANPPADLTNTADVRRLITLWSTT